MLNWLPLTSEKEVDAIEKESHDHHVMIFKHSTTCSISIMSLRKIESTWDLNGISTYYVDLKSNRGVSNYIAKKFEVFHESPQVLLIYNGQCIYDESHFDINIEDIKESIEESMTI